MTKTRRRLYTGGNDSDANRRKLFAAVRDNDITEVKRLVGKEYVTVDIHESTAQAPLLTVAAENGYIDIVKYLIKHCPSGCQHAVDMDNFTPLVHTVEKALQFTERDKRNTSGELRPKYKDMLDTIKELLHHGAKKSIKLGNSSIPILELLNVSDEDILKIFRDKNNNKNNNKNILTLGPAYYNHLYNNNNNNNNRKKTRKHKRAEFSPTRVNNGY
jgi:hypothetical protein